MQKFSNDGLMIGLLNPCKTYMVKFNNVWQYAHRTCNTWNTIKTGSWVGYHHLIEDAKVLIECPNCKDKYDYSQPFFVTLQDIKTAENVIECGWCGHMIEPMDNQTYHVSTGNYVKEWTK